jgi:hypothetical protein
MRSIQIKTCFTASSVVVQSSCSRSQEKGTMLDLQESEMILEVAEIDIEARVKSLICFRDMRLCLGIHTRTFEHMLLHLEDITEHVLHQPLTSIPLRMHFNTAQTGLFDCLRQKQCLLLVFIFIQGGGSLNDRRQVYVLQ